MTSARNIARRSSRWTRSRRRKARAAIERANADNGGRVVTTIEPLGEWYPAEDYHQDYWAGEGQRNPYCLADHPAQAAEAAQELPGAGEERAGDRLGGGAAQAVVDRRAESLIRHRRDGDARLGRRVGAVKQVEQPRRRLDQIARRAEAVVACDVAEADQIFVRRAPRSRSSRSGLAGA